MRIGRTWISGTLLLMLGAGLLWYLLLRQVSLPALRTAVCQADPRWMAAAVGVMGLYFLCDACNTRRGLRHLGYRPAMKHCFQYAAAGFFFSSITPSATGGQPMQICYMRRHGVNPGHGALVLLLELACWQAVTVLYGVAGMFLGREALRALPAAARWMAAAGLTLNILLLAAVTAAIVRPEWAVRLGRRGARRLEGRPRAAKLWESVRRQLERYAQGAPLVRQAPGLVCAVWLTTAVQLLALYSVPYWIYRALGLSGWSLPATAALQASVSLAVNALPLPGGMGVGEGGFLTVFHLLFPAQLLGSAMVLSRGVSLYLAVAVTGAALLVCRLLRSWTGFRRQTG